MQWLPALLAFISATLSCEGVDAAVIRLKNGNTLYGDIEEVSEQQVAVDIAGVGRLFLERREISSIEEESSAEGREEVVSPHSAEDHGLQLRKKAETRETVGLEISETIDQSYSGKYAQHRTYTAVLKSINAIREKAVATIQRRTGLGYPTTADIRLRFADYDGEERLTADTVSETTNGRTIQVITIYMELLITRQTDVQATTTHEFIHAFMRAQMGKKYQALPKWLREAIAVWGADQLEDKTWAVLGNAIFSGKPPFSTINGLESSHHDTSDYMEDALLFEFIVRRGNGMTRVKSAIEAIVAGNDYRETLQEATNSRSWTKLQDDLRAFSLGYVEDVLSRASYSRFQTTDDLLKARRYQEAIAKFQEWMQDNPRSFLIPEAWYRIAQCQYRLKRYEDASKSYQIILDDFPQHEHLQDDAQYMLAKSFEHLKERTKTEHAYRTLLRDYPYTAKDRLDDARSFLDNPRRDAQP